MVVLLPVHAERQQAHADYHEQHFSYFAVHFAALGQYLVIEDRVADIRGHNAERGNECECQEYHGDIAAVPDEHLRKTLDKLGFFHAVRAYFSFGIRVATMTFRAEMAVLVFVPEL